MVKKTRVRSILELPGRNLSAREVAKSLSVSRNTVSEVQALFLESGKLWEEISDWDDDKLYELFYSDTHNLAKYIKLTQSSLLRTNFFLNFFIKCFLNHSYSNRHSLN